MDKKLKKKKMNFTKNIKVIFAPVFYCLNILKNKRLFKAFRFNFLLLTIISLTVLIPFKIYFYPPDVSLQEAKAATVIWNGEGASTDWSDLNNWDINAVPTGTDIVIFDGTTGTSPDKNCTIDDVGTWSGGDFTIGSDYSGTVTLSVASVTTGSYSQAGGTFDCGSNTLNLGTVGAGAYPNFTKTGGTFNEGTGTIVFAGRNTTFNVDVSETLYNVEVNKTNSTYDSFAISSGDTMVVAGTLTLTAGEVHTGIINAEGDITVGSAFNQGNAAMTLSGTNAQAITLTADKFPTGAFTVNKFSNTATTSGTLTVAGALTIQEGTLSLGGDTTFNGGITVQDGGTLSCSTGGTTITIDDADTMTVDSGGMFNLQGASGNLITLQSDTTEAWSLIMNGSHDMDYIDVSYSDASGGDTMYAYDSIDSLNNTNWVINAGAPVSMDHFTITGSATQTAGDSQVITITAIGDDSNTYEAYTGDHDLTFSGASNAPDGTVPMASDNNPADVNFGTATTLTFTSGVATTTIKLYTAESAEIEVDDETYNSEGSADYDLDVTVSAAALNNFLVAAPVSADSGTAFSTTITSRDEYNNTTFSVSGDTIIAVDQGSVLPASLTQDQFTDDGTWTGNITITNITEQLSVSLSATNGTPTGSDSISILGIPADPTGCSASRVSDTEFTITWSDNSSIETGYKIERRTDGVDWDEIDTITTGSPGNNNSYSDMTTSADHKYEYRVLGYNSIGDSASYSTDAAEHYTTPDAPSNVAGTYVSNSEFTVSYTDNAAVEDTHQIERCSNGNCDGTYETDLGTFESSPQTDNTGIAVDSRYRLWHFKL